MSILIKGMEMPMYWYECPFCSDGYCFMIQDGDDRICLVNSKKDTHRNENCPLIEIPPHGRLIDADALKEAFCGNCFADEKPMECSEPCMDMRIILEAPTIIPAEEGET